MLPAEGLEGATRANYVGGPAQIFTMNGNGSCGDFRSLFVGKAVAIHKGLLEP